MGWCVELQSQVPSRLSLIPAKGSLNALSSRSSLLSYRDDRAYHIPVFNCNHHVLIFLQPMNMYCTLYSPPNIQLVTMAGWSRVVCVTAPFPYNPMTLQGGESPSHARENPTPPWTAKDLSRRRVHHQCHLRACQAASPLPAALASFRCGAPCRQRPAEPPRLEVEHPQTTRRKPRRAYRVCSSG